MNKSSCASETNEDEEELEEQEVQEEVEEGEVEEEKNEEVPYDIEEVEDWPMPLLGALEEWVDNSLAAPSLWSIPSSISSERLSQGRSQHEYAFFLRSGHLLYFPSRNPPKSQSQLYFPESLWSQPICPLSVQ